VDRQRAVSHRRGAPDPGRPSRPRGARRIKITVPSASAPAKREGDRAQARWRGPPQRVATWLEGALRLTARERGRANSTIRTAAGALRPRAPATALRAFPLPRYAPLRGGDEDSRPTPLPSFALRYVTRARRKSPHYARPAAAGPYRCAGRHGRT
jgi:hypothetical protein